MAVKKHEKHWTAFVKGVVSDPAAPPSTQLLLGYLGASSEDGHTRLYFDPQLSDYAEIPDSAILHVETPPKDSSDPLRATWVWIEGNAQVLRGPAGDPLGAERSPAAFLDGKLRSAHLGGAGVESAVDTQTHPPMGVTSCHPPGGPDTHTHPPQGVTNCHPPPLYGPIDTKTHPPQGVTNCHPPPLHGPIDTTTHPPMGVTNCHPPPLYGPIDTTTHPPQGVTNCHPPGYGPVAYDTSTHPPQGVTACHPHGYQPQGSTWPPTACCPTAWCRHGS